MQCDKIRELLLTDYADGQIDGQLKQQVDQHLATCLSCKELADLAQKAALEPFGKAQVFQPPERVWTHIKSAILENKNKAGLLENFWQRLVHALAIPRPVLAFAMVLVMIAMFGTADRVLHQAQNRNADVLEYLTSLDDPSEETPTLGEKGYGTVVEQYFL